MFGVHSWVFNAMELVPSIVISRESEKTQLQITCIYNHVIVMITFLF